MADSVEIAYDKADLRRVLGAFKAMDAEATVQAKAASGALAEFAQDKIVGTAVGRGRAAEKIARGSRVSKSSKIGELSFGFAGQKFSGGGTTQQLWGGNEFGSNKYKQFPIWSGLGQKVEDLTAGLFIQPCAPFNLKSLPSGKIAFDKILKEF